MNITADLIRRLRLRFNGGDGTVILFEVGDGAGSGNRGWSDAIAMQTWPSKGLHIVGFEVKASRADWLKELDDPAKNQRWQAAVDAWYVVAPKSVVKVEELPPSWGLMVPKGDDGLRITSRPEVRPSDGEMSRELAAAIFRAAGNERRWASSTARREIREEERQRLRDEIEKHRKAAAEWESNYRELAGALGHTWENLDRLKRRAEAVRATEDIEAKQLVENLRLRLERAATNLRAIEGGLDDGEPAA